MMTCLLAEMLAYINSGSSNFFQLDLVLLLTILPFLITDFFNRLTLHGGVPNDFPGLLSSCSILYAFPNQKEI